LPKRVTYSEPNSDTYRYTQHNANTNTFGHANAQSDRHAKRNTTANSNTQDSSNTKTASDAARLIQPTDILKPREHCASETTCVYLESWRSLRTDTDHPRRTSWNSSNSASIEQDNRWSLIWAMGLAKSITTR
jgi:hypothetical protein